MRLTALAKDFTDLVPLALTLTEALCLPLTDLIARDKDLYATNTGSYYCMFFSRNSS